MKGMCIKSGFGIGNCDRGFDRDLDVLLFIRTRHVSFSILIGRNSVAEWLIVASTYHLNSDPK